MFRFRCPVRCSGFNGFNSFINNVINALFTFLGIRLLVGAVNLRGGTGTRARGSCGCIRHARGAEAVSARVDSLFTLCGSAISSLSFRKYGNGTTVINVSSRVLDGDAAVFDGSNSSGETVLTFRSRCTTRQSELTMCFEIMCQVLYLLLRSSVRSEIHCGCTGVVHYRLARDRLYLLECGTLACGNEGVRSGVLGFGLLGRLPTSGLFSLCPFCERLGRGLSGRLSMVLCSLHGGLRRAFIFKGGLTAGVPFPAGLTGLSLFCGITPDEQHISVVFEIGEEVDGGDASVRETVIQCSSTRVEGFFRTCLLRLFSGSVFRICTGMRRLGFGEAHAGGTIYLDVALRYRGPGQVLVLAEGRLSEPVLSITPMVVKGRVLWLGDWCFVVPGMVRCY